MNSFQWMIRRYTSADVQLTPAELKNIERRCNELVTAHQRRFWVIIVLTGTTTIIAAFAGGRVLGPPVASLIGMNTKFGIAGASIASALIAVVLWFAVFTRMYVRPLRRALTELGHPVCLRCGYSLTGLGSKTERCPECGRPVATSVPSASP